MRYCALLTLLLASAAYAQGTLDTSSESDAAPEAAPVVVFTDETAGNSTVTAEIIETTLVIQGTPRDDFIFVSGDLKTLKVQLMTGFVSRTVKSTVATFKLADTPVTKIVAFGGAGNDGINMGQGWILRGSKGYYLVPAIKSQVPCEIHGGPGYNILIGSRLGPNVLDGTESSKSQLIGGDLDDILTGGDGNDQLFGQQGNDTLTGGAGNDQIYGGGGIDYLDGGEGRDYLVAGGGGDDVMISGEYSRP